MKYNISKILLFVIIVIFSKSCVITQKIGRDDIILKENKIFIDGQLLKKDSLTPLIVQKKKQLPFWHSNFSINIRKHKKKSGLGL